jgi:hypothetical protein
VAGQRLVGDGLSAIFLATLLHVVANALAAALSIPPTIFLGFSVVDNSPPTGGAHRHWCSGFIDRFLLESTCPQIHLSGESPGQTGQPSEILSPSGWPVLGITSLRSGLDLSGCLSKTYTGRGHEARKRSRTCVLLLSYLYKPPFPFHIDYLHGSHKTSEIRIPQTKSAAVALASTDYRL